MTADRSDDGSSSEAMVSESWDVDGYVTGITYPRRYYRELNPANIAFTALQCGYPTPRLDRPFRYLDLGCGHGQSPTLFAALFPQGYFMGVDSNPQHIASAEQLRVAAGLDNASFSTTTFAAMLGDTTAPEGDCDFIVMHGVMSWVSDAVQRDILKLIDRRLKPGGILYVSYNCQPGWAAKMPLREALVEAYHRTSGATVKERLDKVLAFLQRLAESGAQYIQANPSLGPLLEMIKAQDAGYLAHEFLNRHWTVFHHRDMADRMKSVGLDYIGSANAADNVRLLSVPEKPAALMDAMPDSVMREMVRDIALDRQFRRDLYVRDLAALSLNSYIAAMKDTRFVLARAREECDLTVKRSFGDVHLDAAIFNPLLDRLVAGPAQFNELSAVPPLNGWGIADQIQAIQVLVGADFVRPIVAGATVSPDNDAVKRFNQAATEVAIAAECDDAALAMASLSDALVMPVKLPRNQA